MKITRRVVAAADDAFPVWRNSRPVTSASVIFFQVNFRKIKVGGLFSAAAAADFFIFGYKRRRKNKKIK